jgi:hypothetical protein
MAAADYIEFHLRIIAQELDGTIVVPADRCGSMDDNIGLIGIQPTQRRLFVGEIDLGLSATRTLQHSLLNLRSHRFAFRIFATIAS